MDFLITLLLGAAVAFLWFRLDKAERLIARLSEQLVFLSEERLRHPAAAADQPAQAEEPAEEEGQPEEEIEADPIDGAFHMELSTVPSRYQELPEDKLLAFVCAGNVRSVQAAEYLAAMNYGQVCVLDKFSL